VTRAQRYSADDAFAHFSLFGLVTAGRSQPREGFDAEAMIEHLSVHVEALRSRSTESISSCRHRETRPVAISSHRSVVESVPTPT
jgi:hypothetical protein